MTTVKVVLNKSWQHKAGTYPLVFQILHSRKKKILYTGYRVFESDFDGEQQKVHPEGQGKLSGRAVRRINIDLRKRRKAILDNAAQLEKSGFEYTVDDLQEKNVRKRNIRFFEYMEEQIATKRKAGKEGTAAAYASSLNSFRLFLGNKDVNVSDVTPKLVRCYGDFLAENRISDNTVAYYMRNLKAVYNRIVSDGFKRDCEYPFKEIRTTIGKTPKRALDRETLLRIATLEFDPVKESFMELARDIFMFSFYCRGSAFVDIIHLKTSDIISGVIVFHRQKSRQLIRVTVIPQLEELIHKYDNDTEYVFPVLDVNGPVPLYKQYKQALQRINYGLKAVGKHIGLDYPLTTYLARHTWATLVKNLGIPVSVISEGLGHTSERTTLIYLKEFDTDVLDKVNEEVANLDKI